MARWPTVWPMDKPRLLFGVIKDTKYRTDRWEDLIYANVTGPRGGRSLVRPCPGTADLLHLWVHGPSRYILLAPSGAASYRAVTAAEAKVRTSSARSRPDIASMIAELDAAEDESAVALLMELVQAASVQDAPSPSALRAVIDVALSRA